MGRKKQQKVQSEREDEEYYSSEQFVAHGESKSKKISKDVQDKGAGKQKQKKQRKKTGAKLGRPPVDQQTIDVYPDPTSNIQEKILNYLDSIGLKHGLVFRNEDRKKLNEEQKNPFKIEWTPDHEWDRKKEEIKLKNNQQVVEAIERYVDQLNPSKPFTTQEMFQTFLNIGAIAAQQCTEEIYIILAKVLIVIISNTPESQIAVMAEDLFQNLKFFSGNFTKIHIKYWLEIKSHPQEERMSKFVELLSDLSKQVKECLNDGKQEELRKYLKQEQDSNRQLERIIKEFEEKTK